MKAIREKFEDYLSRKFLMKVACFALGTWMFLKVLAVLTNPTVTILIIYFAFLLSIAGLYDFANLGLNKILNGRKKKNDD